MRAASIFYSVIVLCASRRGVWGSSLVSQLRNDANLDLSVDEEYEDLRAELLAYHTAFASLAAAQRADAIGPEEPNGRRSMKSTPCWQLGGICIKNDLCPKGNRYLTEVLGCRDKLHVCCFSWNQFKIKDMTEFGIKNWALPWSVHQEFGGAGFKDEASENDSDLPLAKNQGSEGDKENKPNHSVEKQSSDKEQPSNDENVQDTGEAEQRLRKRRNKHPLAIIVKHN